MKSYQRSLELVLEASTQVATMAQKLLAIAAINLKVDRCSRFSVSDMALDGLKGKKFSDLLCILANTIIV